MADCSYCRRKIEDIPFKCHRCTGKYCSKHRLPEDHKCLSLLKQKEKNQDRWVNVIKGYNESLKSKDYSIPKRRGKRHRRKHRKYSPHNYKPHAPTFQTNVTKRTYLSLNLLKRNKGKIVLLLVLLGLAFYLGIIPIPFVNQCEDGTIYNHCSKTKPNYCSEGVLYLNATHCGCPFDYRPKGNSCEEIPKCVDGTRYSACSPNKPSYCDEGKLIDRADLCGCPYEYVQEGERCKSKYETGAKTVKLYGIGDFVVYQGVHDYLAIQDRSISYYSTPPTAKDFILKDLNNKIQTNYLNRLVEEIRKKSDNPKEQARIAIRMVQSIPYDWSAFETDNVEGRYPYEVLYDMEGVCMEKADLMAYLLRGLGFGVAIFEYELESHRAVGIKCDKGNYGSNYCFIEATDYYPVGQIPFDYVGGVNIRNAHPEIIVISEGISYS